MTQAARILIVALVAAALVAAFTAAPGTFDDYAFVEWAKIFNQPGPLAGYRLLAHQVHLDYPPIGVTLMWLALRAGDVFGLPDLIAFKMSLAVLAVAGALVAFGRRQAPLDALILLLISTLYGVILGYTDVVYLPFLLMALYAACAERIALAGLALSLAAFIKWQPIILAPIFLAAAIQQVRGVMPVIRIMMPTAIFVAVILLAFGPVTVTAVLFTATSDPFLGGQGVNFAWLASYLFELLHIGGQHLQSSGAIAIVNTPSPSAAIDVTARALRLLFYGLFLATLGIYIAGRKNADSFMISALSCAMVQFTLNTGVHENHLFVSFVVAFAAWQAGALDDFTFAAIATVAGLNVFVFYGAGDGFNFGNLAGLDGTAFLAAAELLVYGLVFNRQLRICLFSDANP
jgi:hypothetical protein